MNYLGANFNLQTGKELELTDIFSMGEDELLQYLHEQSVQFIEQHPENPAWSDEERVEQTRQTINEYTLDKYEFYIQENTVYLCYPTYSLADGATGPVVVPCPIK